MKNLVRVLACLLASLAVYAAQPSEAQRQAADRTIDILTKAYDANKRLSYNDGLALLKFADLNHGNAKGSGRY
jgi:hypothetical protein